MIQLKSEDGHLYARYEREYGGTVSVDVSIYEQIRNGKDILAPLLRYVERVRRRSAVNYLRAVVELGRAIKRAGCETVPVSEDDWQNLILEIHHQVIVNPQSRASLRTRVVDTLGAINTFLEHLRNEGLIPLGVIIPRIRRGFRAIASSAQPHALLGSSDPLVVHKFNQKLISDISLSRTDAEYLDQLHEDLRGRLSALRSTLVNYWLTLRSHAEWGQQAIRKVDVQALIARMQWKGNSEDPSGKFRGPSVRHICNPSTEAGLRNFLALSVHLFGGIPTHSELRSHPLLPRSVATGDYEIVNPCGVHRLLPITWSEERRLRIHRHRMRWFLGRLSLQDIAVLSAILAIEHPRFTPEAITHSRLVDRNGKKMVEFRDGAGTFVVEKHRAHAVKKARLSPLSMEIVSFVASLSPDIRGRLRAEHNRLGDLLFIPFDVEGRKPIPLSHERIVGFLSGQPPHTHRVWLGAYAPELTRIGITRGQVTFTKIRHTQGVLEWFRTGNTRSVSRVLGNKEKTVMNHYIPPQLLQAWNVRLVRRFQNLWIAVAAAGEDFALEVTDFSSASELSRFLTTMLLQHAPTSSPLAAQLHERLGSEERSFSASDAARSFLSVSISKASLAALYCYHDAVIAARLSAERLDRRDPTSGICPRAFVDLSTLLRHQLPEHTDPSFREMHGAAEALSSELAPRLAWAELIAKEVDRG